MTKKERKLIKDAGFKPRQFHFKWKPNATYSLGNILGEEYQDEFISTDSEGRIKAFLNPEEHQAIKDAYDKKEIDKETDKQFKKLLKKEKAKSKLKKDMNRKELKMLKEDPGELRAKLDKAYLAYDEANALVEDAVEDTAEERVARTKKRIAMKKLYDTATATGSITGEDEKTKAFQYVIGDKLEGKSERERGGFSTGDLHKTYDVSTPDIKLPEKTDIKKLSDEELIKRLQLGK